MPSLSAARGINELLELQEYRIVHVVNGIPIPGEVSMALSFVAAAVLTFLGFADLFITLRGRVKRRFKK